MTQIFKFINKNYPVVKTIAIIVAGVSYLHYFISGKFEGLGTEMRSEFSRIDDRLLDIDKRLTKVETVIILKRIMHASECRQDHDIPLEQSGSS